MTTCFKFLRALQRHSRPDSPALCAPCVYFSRNLDESEYPVLLERRERCGLGFLPGDRGCAEMRTDNCSARRSR